MKKRFAILLLCTLFLQCTYGKLKLSFLDDAITKAAKEFLALKDYGNHAVFVIKVISFSKNKGEFSISYVYNDYSYSEIKPSHYFMIDNYIFLIKTDYLNEDFSKLSHFNSINETDKQKVLDTLAGPNLTITAQPPSVSVYSYKKKKVTFVAYDKLWKADDKYYYFNEKRN